MQSFYFYTGEVVVEAYPLGRKVLEFLLDLFSIRLFSLSLTLGSTFVEEHKNSNNSPYKFNGKELDDETGNYYYGARYYNPKTSIWLSVDPKAEKYSGWSPYSYTLNNPINLTDPTGKVVESPVYDKKGNLLGTDDQGLQGKAIVMNKSDFTQGMKHSEAMKKDKGLVFNSSSSKTKFEKSYNNLSKRPDWDGKVNLGEANEWYRTGEGKPLYTDLGKLNLNMVNENDFPKGQGSSEPINLLRKGNIPDGVVYGTITLTLGENRDVMSISDNYGFEMHAGRHIRNTLTKIGKNLAGKGTPFNINFYGKGKIGTPFVPQFPVGPKY